ncbi:MAG: DUF1648 domain-containing protein [Ferruginibacter sp.]
MHHTQTSKTDIIEMETRPKIKLALSKLDNNVELTSKIFLVVMWSLTLYTFLKLPTTVPIHFNGTGQADRYGNKMTLLILPVLATIIYFGLTQLNKYPHIFNYMTKINDDNAEKQYTIATRMLRFLKLSILLIFSLVILFTYLTTIGVANGLGFWFLPLTFGLLLIPTIICISQSLKKKNNVA